MQKKSQFRRLLSIIMLLFLALAGTPTTTLAQDDCLQCHSDEGSIVKRSEHDFLSCVSCHRDIEKFPHPEDASLDKKESVATCALCHEGRITDSYGDSFHGKAVHLGSEKSATCVDCHGAHNVLNSENPDSQVAKENIPETCASCHNQASPGFAEGEEHYKFAAFGAGAPMYYTAKFFIWLTLITITALVLHMELQLYQNLRAILRERKRR
ncbi:MAG: molecular chaperone DnaJ [Gracilibacter sp. BRH_c7a]|nr:MAG: molecular chaperone DnaJ [Gracilibacter sp. BRH_c7a]